VRKADKGESSETPDRTKKLRDLSVDELQRREAGNERANVQAAFSGRWSKTETLNKMRELAGRARLLTIMSEKNNG
jgi:hypothetical protein